MNNTKNFSPHIIGLSSLYILGNGALIFPLTGTDEFGFSAYLIALLALVVFYLSVSFLLDKIKFPKILSAICLPFVAVGALFVGAEAFKDIVNFANLIILPESSAFFVVLAFTVVAVYFALKSFETVFKFSLVSFVLVLIVILFFFIAPMDKYNLRNIYIFRLPDLNSFLPQFGVYLINPVLQSVVLAAFLKMGFGKSGGEEANIGVLIGGVLLSLCILAPILLFGAKLSGNFDFPFSSTAETVTVGRLFTRLDGFVYFMYFTTSIVKITVCLKTVFYALENAKIRFGNK
ncbi:MAG: GerAB/ArcD/ProY family transporter [Clostridia bacterium]|nr:GerAB/ArcD/ProY family transporter [Clostridia bacterium]